jgi:hypothetical protein
VRAAIAVFIAATCECHPRDSGSKLSQVKLSLIITGIFRFLSLNLEGIKMVVEIITIKDGTHSGQVYWIRISLSQHN